MSAGTIRLTNGSTAVVGTGTAFTSDLKSGDVITATVGGIFSTLFVGAVTSNTALTLTDPFTGPTTAGQAWVAVPQLTLNRITAALAAQTAESVRRILQENANWQAFYSGTGDITVTLPDGSPTGRQVPGPSWKKISDLINASDLSAIQLLASATQANATQAAADALSASSSKSAAKTSETNAKTSETNSKTSETNAAASLAAAQLLTSVPYEASPYPDVWAPLNDDLRLLAGFAPYDKLTISGQVLELPTKSMTLTRNSTATYIDKSGVLQTAAINEPRFEKEGLLIEGQSTNFVPNSLSTSPTWRVANSTVTQASIISPDGTTNGVTKLASAGGVNTPTGSAISVPISGLAVGGYCSFSVFAKADSHNLIQLRWLGGTAGVSGGYLNVDLSTGETGGSTLFYAKVISMANGWWRIIAITTVDGDLTGNTSIDPGVELISSLSDGRRPAVSIPSGNGVYLFGPQIEALPFATSYVPTAGAAVTRAADVPTLQRSGNENYFGPFAYSAEIQTLGPMGNDTSTNARRGILSFYPTSLEYVMTYIDSTASSAGKLRNMYGAANFAQSINRMDDGLIHVFVFSTDLIKNKLSLDGVTSEILTASRPTPGSPSPQVADKILIGWGAGSTVAGNRVLNGHIRNLRIWHRALTDNQIKGLR